MKIYIEKLTFDTIIGILPFERVNEQEVIIDISFDYDYDKNNDFIDYSHVVDIVKNTMHKEKFELIEDAILYLEDTLTKKYPIKNFFIKITKPTILEDCSVCASN